MGRDPEYRIYEKCSTSGNCLEDEHDDCFPEYHIRRTVDKEELHIYNRNNDFIEHMEVLQTKKDILEKIQELQHMDVEQMEDLHDYIDAMNFYLHLYDDMCEGELCHVLNC